MGYSGPHSDPVRVHYPIETKEGTPDWQAVVIENNIDNMGDDLDHRRSGIDQAYWRGGLIAFRTGPLDGGIGRGQWVWVMRRFNARGGEEYHETPLHRWLGPKENNIPDEEFWHRYRDAVTHPGILLHIAAQQAMESMKDL